MKWRKLCVATLYWCSIWDRTLRDFLRLPSRGSVVNTSRSHLQKHSPTTCAAIRSKPVAHIIILTRLVERAQRHGIPSSPIMDSDTSKWRATSRLYAISDLALSIMQHHASAVLSVATLASMPPTASSTVPYAATGRRYGPIARTVRNWDGSNKTGSTARHCSTTTTAKR